MNQNEVETFNSILNSIKKAIGLYPEQIEYNDDILMYINTSLSEIHQMCKTEAKEPFQIYGSKETWMEFSKDVMKVSMTKTLLVLKVKNLFDPPTTSFLLDAAKDLITQAEYRLKVACELAE